MRFTIRKSCVLISAMLLAALAPAAFGAAGGKGPACGLCGAAAGETAVVVTDWETNRQYTYHDLSCAVREMQTRFPWSRAVTSSPVSGQRITLTRISGGWSAQPESAVALRLVSQPPPTGAEHATPQCENVVALASADELRAYRDKHKGQVPPKLVVTPLADLPAQLLMLPVRQTAAGELPIPQPVTGQAPAQPQPTPAPSAARFKDVPADHWAASSVEKVAALGLMQGYADGTFRGDEPVMRYQMAAILARLAAREPNLATEQAAVAAPLGAGAQAETVTPSAPPDLPPAPASLPSRPEGKAKPASASLWGASGLLEAPDARTRPAGSGVAVAGSLAGRFLGAAALGVGDGIEVSAASGEIGGQDRVFVGAKKRLDRLSRPGLEVAAGITGLGTATSVYAAATKALPLGRRQAELTAGLGSGGVLEGPFAGVRLPVADRLSVLAETVEVGDDRDFNYGLDYGIRPDLAVRLGSTNGRFTGALVGQRGF